jgi:hypothetical protein
MALRSDGPAGDLAMKKRKRKKFDAAREARRRARESAAKPAVTRVIVDKRKRPTKHKKDWVQEAAN